MVFKRKQNEAMDILESLKCASVSHPWTPERYYKVQVNQGLYAQHVSSN